MTVSAPLLKKKDLQSKIYAVVFFNSTSQTELRSEEKVKIIEIGEDWLTLQVPKSSCALKHKLMIHLMPINDVAKLKRGQLRNQIPFAVSIMVNVEEYTSLSDAVSLIKVTFTQYSKAEWGEFRKEWDSIQKKVDHQFKEMKE